MIFLIFLLRCKKITFLLVKLILIYLFYLCIIYTLCIILKNEAHKSQDRFTFNILSIYFILMESIIMVLTL